MQKEVGMLHKELKLVRTEFATANEQLRKDMETRFKAISLKTRQMFSHIMFKFDSSQRGGFKGFGSIKTSDLKEKRCSGNSW